jgi:dTDP-4-amino-4,6-dideoxygalactose transaminase
MPTIDDLLAAYLLGNDLEPTTEAWYRRIFGVFRQWSGPDILSCSSALSRRVLSLPIYPELTDLQVDYVADQVLACVNNSG